MRKRTRSRFALRKRPLTTSELDQYAKDFVAKVVTELSEYGELLTVTYLLVDDDFVLVPAVYRTSLEKDIATAAIDALTTRLQPPCSVLRHARLGER